ncbi:MAG: preprotein translocase subunit SecE [Pseudomonadota bacterium]
MANPVQFLQQVRQEAGKVSWPSRRETLITTGMVLLFVLVTSLFFLGVDQLIAVALSYLLGFGR